jgi:hypothetical protein
MLAVGCFRKLIVAIAVMLVTQILEVPSSTLDRNACCAEGLHNFPQ